MTMLTICTISYCIIINMSILYMYFIFHLFIFFYVTFTECTNKNRLWNKESRNRNLKKKYTIHD